MAILDPIKTAERWAQGMQGASQRYSEGIDSVMESPMEKAAQQQAKYLQGIQDAVSSGKWAAGLRRTSLSQWKEKAKQIGAQRLASGAIAAKPKVQAFLAEFLPFLEGVRNRVRSMPSTTFEERMARMNEQARAVHQFRRS